MHQTGNGQLLQMKRKASIGLSTKAFSNCPHGKPLGPRLNEQPEYLQTGFLRQRIQRGDGFVDSHISIIIELYKLLNDSFMTWNEFCRERPRLNFREF